MDFLQTIQPWHWLILGFFFLGLEALGAGGFLLGSAAASLLLALLVWLISDMGWATQLWWFAGSSLIFTVTYWKVFRKVNETSDHPELNQRAAQLVGRILILDTEIAEGQGRVQIGDTMWKVKANSTLKKGSKVVIYGYEGMVLLLELK